MKNDNIVAIATALGASGVAVTRLSGDTPLKILEKMFRPINKDIQVKDFVPYVMYVGEIDCGTFTDFGMAVYFKGPKSFTGEDVVEIHSHGGSVIPQGVVKKALSLGARLAGPGEFSKRAFINGKLSLSGAEGLIDMINASGEAGARAGYYLYREKFTREVEKMQDGLLNALSEIDADMDFPEEDLGIEAHDKVRAILFKTLSGLELLISTYHTGRVLKNGVKVGIVGKPNTGKSSLLNALMGTNRAIVSDFAGTTRDIVEGAIDYAGVRFNFSDTAGIRESTDKIEKMGVLLSKKILDESDLLLFVLDGGDLGREDSEIFTLIKDKNVITVLNKSDITEEADIDCDIKVSAITGDNILELKKLIFEKTIGSGIDINADFICEERHFYALQRAKDAVKSAIESMGFVTIDVLAIDIKEAWETLGEISGKTATEEIINNIFSKFCVGK